MLDRCGPKAEASSDLPVQTFEGHSSLQVTMDLYGRLFKSDDHKEAMDMIAAALLLA